ncbi:probable G-protein coupled receptor 139 isoform X1 [Hemiscyllium ocellatum]|uniref:probable G-protein coupled receptor 139 isoform X1 n=1 Tax=Hemiscyllium ocellatum TaxID=170820 RepID=UPI002965FA3C|nr:probable G-protein coupled receptor 139 isoform X1 [Hemiscyllium ocellatum]
MRLGAGEKHSSQCDCVQPRGEHETGPAQRPRYVYRQLPHHDVDQLQAGSSVNIMTIVILYQRKCGLSTCTTYYLTAMATSDLLIIVTEVIFRRINYHYFPVNFLNITPVCTGIYVLLRTALDCSVWFTTAFTFDRFVFICCSRLKTKYCTKKTAAAVISTSVILFYLKNIPIHFRFKPAMIIKNIPWFCSNKWSYNTDPRWIGFRMFEKVLTPMIPFFLILLLNSLTVRFIFVASRARKALKCQRKGGDLRDTEMESRRNSVILLFTISGSFTLLWLVYVLYIFGVFRAIDPFGIRVHVAYMLRNLNCCTNTFLYVATQSKFRKQVKSLLMYPIASVVDLFTKL